MPGVPGIGVKTAAQLIGEYGDLETLLKRAGEIKQEKRRQTLIENAELARLSKRLVTLDDKVKLDVPIGELAVHDPDYRRLIAFLKAMEFNTLTRRVAEFAEVDIGEVEPDEKHKAGGSAGASPPPPAGEVASEAKREGASHRLRLAERPPRYPSPQAGEGASRRLRRQMVRKKAPHGRRRSAAITPQALAAARAESARSIKVDRSRYETVRTLDRLNAWIARAQDIGMVAIDTETTSLDPMQATLCGFSLALAPNEACYVPLAHRQGGDGNGGLFQGEHRARPDS